MSLRQFITPLCLIGIAGIATAAQAQSVGDAVMDAEGRVFGNAVPVSGMPGMAMPTPQMALPAQQMAMPAPQMAMPASAVMPRMAAPAAPTGPAPAAQWDNAGFERAKADWLYECRRRYPAGKKGTTLGAVLGGVVGGVLGNRIAGRGDRTVGTVAGAVLGGVAGGAIGNSADRSRSRDYCESYLEDYLARQQYGYGQYGYSQPGVTYGYVQQQVTMMVPVMMVQQQAAIQPKRECKETIVTEEWVPVRAKRRVIYKTVTVPDKRVRIVPDKRVRIN